MAPFFYLTSGRGGGNHYNLLDAIFQKEDFMCILTCEIFF